MPIINIDITPLPLEKKAELAQVFTDELHRITNIPKETVHILFHDLQMDHIAVGGHIPPQGFNADHMKTD